MKRLVVKNVLPAQLVASQTKYAKSIHISHMCTLGWSFVSHTVSFSSMWFFKYFKYLKNQLLFKYAKPMHIGHMCTLGFCVWHRQLFFKYFLKSITFLHCVFSNMQNPFILVTCVLSDALLCHTESAFKESLIQYMNTLRWTDITVKGKLLHYLNTRLLIFYISLCVTCLLSRPIACLLFMLQCFHSWVHCVGVSPDCDFYGSHSKSFDKIINTVSFMVSNPTGLLCFSTVSEACFNNQISTVSQKDEVHWQQIGGHPIPS